MIGFHMKQIARIKDKELLDEFQVRLCQNYAGNVQVKAYPGLLFDILQYSISFGTFLQYFFH